MCLTVKTFENITASDPARPTDGKRYTWVEWTLRNAGGTTLTHPTVTVSFADICGASPCSGPSTAQFVLPASPNVCSVSGANLVCTYANIAGGGNTGATRVYFKTANVPATSSVISVTATVNERGNDTNPCAAGDPNCDTFTSSIVNSYEPDPNAAFTFALDNSRFHLPTNDGLSSFTFTSPGSSVFLASFRKLTLAESAGLCFSDVVCFDRALSVDTQGTLSFGASTPVVFFTRLLDAPVTASKLSAIHFYDAVALTASNNRLTPVSGPSFARMDGLSLEAPAFGRGAGKYFVVGYSSVDNSFQLSSTKGGPALTLTPGSGSGVPIRIIGDQADERSTSLCSTAIPASTVTMPKICAVKSGPKAIDTYVWDSGNGRVNW